MEEEAEGGVMARRGRPKKERPKLGDPLKEGMSQRDAAAVFGKSRRWVAQSLDLTHVPEHEFDAVLSGDDGQAKLRLLARLRANKSALYERKCPHCGGLLRIEGQATLAKLIDDEENGKLGAPEYHRGPGDAS